MTLKIGALPDPAKLAALPVDLTLSDKSVAIAVEGHRAQRRHAVHGRGLGRRRFARRSRRPLRSGASRRPGLRQIRRLGDTHRHCRAHRREQVHRDARRRRLHRSGGDRDRPASVRASGCGSPPARIDAAAFQAPADGATKGGDKSGGGEAPIDLSALGLVDANVDFTANSVQVGSVALEESRPRHQACQRRAAGNHPPGRRERRARLRQPHRRRQGQGAGDGRRGEDERPRRRRPVDARRRFRAGHRQRRRRCDVQDKRRDGVGACRQSRCQRHDLARQRHGHRPQPRRRGRRRQDGRPDRQHRPQRLVQVARLAGLGERCADLAQGALRRGGQGGHAHPDGRQDHRRGAAGEIEVGRHRLHRQGEHGGTGQRRGERVDAVAAQPA